MPSFNRVLGKTKSPFDASDAPTVTGHQRPRSVGLLSPCLATYCLVDEQAKFVDDGRDALSSWQPVQLLERRRNVVVGAQSVDQTGGGVEDPL